jgi:hypothetical protein
MLNHCLLPRFVPIGDAHPPADSDADEQVPAKKRRNATQPLAKAAVPRKVNLVGCFESPFNSTKEPIAAKHSIGKSGSATPTCARHASDAGRFAKGLARDEVLNQSLCAR